MQQYNSPPLIAESHEAIPGARFIYFQIVFAINPMTTNRPTPSGQALTGVRRVMKLLM